MSPAIAIVPYNSEWPARFDAEAARLRAGLGALAVRIDHVGSTAVPGLSAKDVIDIQISVATLEPMDAYREPLRQLGYVHMAHPDDAVYPFFHRPAVWPHTHHVHACRAGGTEERWNLAFRDYLRDGAETRRAYEALKRRLAEHFGGDTPASREAYANAKTDFCTDIVARALAAGYPR